MAVIIVLIIWFPAAALAQSALRGSDGPVDYFGLKTKAARQSPPTATLSRLAGRTSPPTATLTRLAGRTSPPPSRTEAAPPNRTEKDITELFSEITVDADGKVSRKLPPAHVMRVLLNPSVEAADKYLEDEEFKMAVLQKAISAIESAQRKRILAQLNDVKITLFTADGCPACETQRQIFKDWNIDFDEKKNPAIKVFPTIVVEKDGKELARFEGVTHPQDIVRGIKS